jgi:hypothetical protein
VAFWPLPQPSGAGDGFPRWNPPDVALGQQHASALRLTGHCAAFAQDRCLVRNGCKGLVLDESDGWDRPPSVMASNRNPKPVQFIQPNVLDGACLSVGKDDGFANQFGLRLTVLIQDIWGMTLHRWHCSSMFSRTVCAVLGGSAVKFVPALSTGNDWWWLLFQFTEPVDLPSQAPRVFWLLFQDRAQSFPDLLNDCTAVSGVYLNAVAHDEASFG